MNGFTIYKEYYELITLLTEKDQQELLLAIVKYMFEDAIPTSNENQNEIKTITNENQNEIKTKAHQDVNVNVIVNDNVDVNGSCIEENINNKYNINNLYSYIEQNYGRTLSSIEIQKINEWSKEFNEEMLQYAIQISILNRKQKFQYVEGILRNWKSQGYKSLQDVKENEERIKNRDYQPTSNTNVEVFDYDWLNDSESNDG